MNKFIKQSIIISGLVLTTACVSLNAVAQSTATPTNKTITKTKTITKSTSTSTVKTALAPAKPTRPVLKTPIDCNIGENCFIQNYMDLDSDSKAIKDYTCNIRTYDGHTGTDIRLVDYKAMDSGSGVNILAAAKGAVLDVTDGYDDYYYLDNNMTVQPEIANTSRDKVYGAIKSLPECGNGVVIQHTNAPDRYYTQYCHLKKNTVAVKIGDSVEQNDKLGLMGMSGATQFPHIHMGLKKLTQLPNNGGFTGKSTDLFINAVAQPGGGACSTTIDPKTIDTFWDKNHPATAKLLNYIDTAVLNLYVTSQDPSLDTDFPSSDSSNPNFHTAQGRKKDNNYSVYKYRENKVASADTKFIWAAFMGIKKADAIIFTIKSTDKNNEPIIINAPIDENSAASATRNHAQLFKSILINQPLDTGNYTVTVEVNRNGVKTATKSTNFSVV